MQTRDEDFVSRLFVASPHTPVLFFSSRGQVYKEKVWRVPVAPRNGGGKALINVLPLEQGERITTIMPLPEDEASWANLDVMFATTGGNVRRNKLSDFVDVRRSGIIAMKLDDNEAIVDVQICTERDDVLLTAAGGQCIRFPVTDVRGFSGRTSMGGRGKGIVAMSVNSRNGKLVASFPVEESDQIMLVTDKGQLIRCPVEGIRIAGRSTQGVIVFDTAEDEHVVSVEHIGEDAENGNGG